MRARVFTGALCLVMLWATPSAFAATVAGVVSDATGAAIAGAKVVVRNVASGRERTVTTGADGKYVFDTPDAGTYLVLITRQGFSEVARTIVIAHAEQRLDVSAQLEIGVINTEVSVTAARADREIRTIPLHVETLSGAAVAQTNPLSSGDALASVAVGRDGLCAALLRPVGAVRGEGALMRSALAGFARLAQSGEHVVVGGGQRLARRRGGHVCALDRARRHHA